MTIENILDQIDTLPIASQNLLIQGISEVVIPKGYFVFKADRVEKSVYFIKRGVVRAFAPMAEKDVTFWFGEEGETILSMKSYVEGKKGYENVQALEDCILYKLSIAYLHDLYRKDIAIANWGRKLAEKELLKIESRMISAELMSAKERYEALMRTAPGLVLRVPLMHIASYLGITQVSLSRIRKII